MTDDRLRTLLFDDLHICKCGYPQSAAKLVRDVLALAPLYDHREEITELLHTEGIQHLVLGLLTEASLLEHGGGIGGSWLTEKGADALASLNRVLSSDRDTERILG